MSDIDIRGKSLCIPEGPRRAADDITSEASFWLPQIIERS